MATNKRKNTTTAKPRRFGVGIVLSCLQRLRRRQPKSPQVLERSLATTVRRGSGRKTVPLDLERVDIASTSVDGGGEITKVDVDAGEEEISLVIEDPSANRDEFLRSIGKLPTNSKQETPLITPTKNITEKSGSATEDQLFDNNDTVDQSLASLEQETDQNTQNTEDLAGNTTVGNVSSVSGDQHVSLDQSWKEEIDAITPDLSETSEKMNSDVTTIKIPTSSFTRDLEAQSFPLLQYSSLPNETTDQTIQDLEETIVQKTENSAVNIKQGQSSPLSNIPNETTDQTTQGLEETIDEKTQDLVVNTKQEHSSPLSNDNQETNERPTKQYSDYWKQDMDAGRTRTTGGVDSKLIRSSSVPSPSLPGQPTRKTYPAFSSPQQSDGNLMATNRIRKEADKPAHIGTFFPTSSPLQLFRELLPWNNQHRSPYGYLLLLPIGMALIFLVILSAWGILLFFLVFTTIFAILLLVGVFAFLLFAIAAVAGTAMLSVWAGTLWALWKSARVGLAAIKFLVSSVSTASSAFHM